MALFEAGRATATAEAAPNPSPSKFAAVAGRDSPRVANASRDTRRPQPRVRPNRACSPPQVAAVMSAHTATPPDCTPLRVHQLHFGGCGRERAYYGRGNK